LSDCADFIVYLCTITAGASAASAPAKVPPLSIDGKPHLPFQLQIEYTAQDGSRNRRVITDAKPTTNERKVAERGMGFCMLEVEVYGVCLPHPKAIEGGEY
jgi:hypothetical protein